MSDVNHAPFGAILAGGESRRYGSPKALATVGGTRIVDRVLESLERAVGDVDRNVVIVANEPGLFDDLGLPTRPDIRPGLGALGGIHTALHWAREAGRPGILAVACDMPFLSVRLLERLREVAYGGAEGDESGADAPQVVVPGSESRRGVEPLCAAYATSCIDAIEAQLGRGESHVIGFYDDVRVRTLPLEEVERLCDPAVAFMNVNTPEERDRAEAIAADREGGPYGQLDGASSRG